MDIPPTSSSSQRHSSSHRLPTVSASEALQTLRCKGPISSGLKRLDSILSSPQSSNIVTDLPSLGGFERGKVTEIWGPPGSGKTTLAIRAAVEAHNAGDSVAWIDAGPPLVKGRFQDILAASTARKSSRRGLKRLKCIRTPTVAHLLALALHAPAGFPPRGTSIMVVDGIHLIFDIAYPRYEPNGFSNRGENTKWAASRRYSMLGTLVSSLKKLAALHDMAIIVTTGCATRVRSGSGLGAVFVPGVSGMEWDDGITNRLVLFRDFASSEDRAQTQGGNTPSARFIGLQKLHDNAIGASGDVGCFLPFVIDKTGPRDTEESVSLPTAGSFALSVASPVRGRKRVHQEIADSDDDAASEYGWLDDDAEGILDAAALNEDPVVVQPDSANG